MHLQNDKLDSLMRFILLELVPVTGSVRHNAVVP